MLSFETFFCPGKVCDESKGFGQVNDDSRYSIGLTKEFILKHNKFDVYIVHFSN